MQTNILIIGAGHNGLTATACDEAESNYNAAHAILRG